MSAGTNTRLGVLLMVATTLIFSIQDGLSLHLSSTYNVYMVVMVRYWFFAAFVMTVSAKQAGGLSNAARTKQPVIQAFRGVLLAAEICVMVTAFTLLGMVESLAIFSAYTLIVAALSGPILGETVGWRRWLAIAVGFCGVLVILEPGFGVFSPYAIIPVLAAFMCAGDFRARIRSVLPLCDHPRSRRFHVRTLQPAHAICRPPRQHRNQLLLDRRHGVPVDECRRRVSF